MQLYIDERWEKYTQYEHDATELKTLAEHSFL